MTEGFEAIEIVFVKRGKSKVSKDEIEEIADAKIREINEEIRLMDDSR